MYRLKTTLPDEYNIPRQEEQDEDLETILIEHNLCGPLNCDSKSVFK